MSLKILFVLFLSGSLNGSIATEASPEPRKLAMEFYNSLDEQQQSTYFRPFDDSRRKTWERLPKEREGLKLTQLREDQKVLFHRFLQASLSSEGYLMITAVMFNEDIQKRFEPYLGRNEYYLELFGMPQEGNYWGWQLEGHHLSVNLTFKGNELLAHTPFLLASNPQIVNSDRDRNGLCLIYLEEQIAGELAESLKASGQEKGYKNSPPPKQVYGELNKAALVVPDEGISLSSLRPPQMEHIMALATAYLRYFNYGPRQKESLLRQMTHKESHFYYLRDTHYNGEHYYRLANENTLVECENYGNHSHHFLRSANDFGQAVIPAGPKGK